jgi:hypothetical protein
MKKLILTLALAALSVSAAHAATVIRMTLDDTLSANGTTLDGKSGAFRFGPINTGTYMGAFLFTSYYPYSDVIDIAAATAPLDWTAGFTFAGRAFLPYTTGPIVADITGGVLTFSSLPFAAYYNGSLDYYFNMTPDSAPTVLNLIQTGSDTYDYRIAFSHLITNVDDPSGDFVDLTAYWILEGTMSTAVPVPAAAWLMGSGLLGLAGVARRRRSV